MARLNEISTSLNNNQSTDQLISKYQDYMRKARVMCQGVWAKFDDAMMAIGLFTVLSVCVVRLASILGFITEKAAAADIALCVLTVVALVLAYLGVIMMYSLSILIAILILVLVYCSKRRLLHLSKMQSFSLFVLVLQGLTSLSNSLVVNEDRVTYFLLQSVLMLLWINNCPTSLSQTKKRSTNGFLYSLLFHPSTVLLALLNIVLGLSVFFNTCREEQTDCQVSPFLTPLSSIHPDYAFYKNVRFFVMAIPCAAILSKLINSILRTRGNLNGYSPLTLVSGYAFPMLAIFLILHWTMSATPLTERLPVWQQTFSAMAVYCLTLVVIAACFIFPLSIYVSDRKRHEVSLTDNSVPTLYKYMKLKLDESEKTISPLVYGLGTAISCSYLILASGITYLLMMLGGDGMAPSQLLNLLALLIFLELTKMWTGHITGILYCFLSPLHHNCVRVSFSICCRALILQTLSSVSFIQVMFP